MEIIIFGGTTEGRLLAEALTEAGMDPVVSCATELGLEQIADIPCRKICGRKNEAELEELLKDFELAVDATHPYAVEVTENIRQACEVLQIKRIRILREESGSRQGLFFPSCLKAAEYLQSTRGNILLTTGSKELEAFSGLEPARLFPRILPVCKSLEACEDLKIPHKNILALQGPFSKEMNLAMIHQYDIRYLVTKDGGSGGGFPEKAAAAEECKIELLVISRPKESGMTVRAFLEEMTMDKPEKIPNKGSGRSISESIIGDIPVNKGLESKKVSSFL